MYDSVTLYKDSTGYIELAKLISGNGLAGYNGERTPGYPLLIVIAGNSLFLTVLIQFALGIVTTIYQYKSLLITGVGKRIAIVASLVFGSLLHVLFYETSILTESFTLFVMTLGIYFTLDGFFSENKNFKNTMVVGFFMGCLVLIKPFFIFIPFLIYGLYTLKYFSLKTVINRRIAVLVFPLIVFLGWSYVNKVNTGYFVSTTFFGVNIAQNCVSFAEKSPEEFKLIRDIYVKHRTEVQLNNGDLSMTIWEAHDELLEKTGMSSPELSYELAKFGKATINKNPVDYSKQVFVSWFEFWRTSFDNQTLNSANPVFKYIWTPQKLLLRGIKVVFVLLIPYYLIQFIRFRKVSPVFILTTLIFAGSVLQAMVTYGNNSRFSFPFEFLMIMVVIITFQEFRRNRRRYLAGA
ncbi:MAG: hypothetical protein EOO45_03025 [Flavobacterium sp.]|nr:MAG: hypothetical protein EOO45_03025 [Flavobacterium sp.]